MGCTSLPLLLSTPLVVVTGARCNLTQEVVAGLVGRPKQAVGVMKERAAFTTFSVKPNLSLKPFAVGG